MSEWTVGPDGIDLREPGVQSERSLLESLVESEEAERTATGYRIGHSALAQLEEEALQTLGLPESVPASLRMRSTGAVVRPETRLLVDWFEDGRRSPLTRRTGAIAEFEGGRRFRVPSPLYELLEAVDGYNASDSSGTDRLVEWGRVKELVPSDEALDDDSLRQVTVHVASAFSIKPILAADGSADFALLPGRWQSSATEGEVASEREFVEILPEAYRDQFERTFRSLAARKAYPVNRGTFVVATPGVAKAFEEVRAIRSEGSDAIRRFVRQPHAVLRTRLEETASEVAAELDEIFGDYGDRVTGVGLWQGKVVPWITKPSAPWLPPETLGVRIGEKSVEIRKEDVAGLTSKIAEAIEAGATAVPYETPSGEVVQLPATHEVLDVVRTLEGYAIPKANEPAEEQDAPSSDEPVRPQGRTVLLIDDNLEDAQFQKQKRSVPRPGEVDLATRMNSTLYPHQRTAFDWLREAWTEGEPGVLLADDMGLGKTIQALAFMAWLRGLIQTGQIVDRPMLVVAPTGLLKNWAEEHDIHLSGAGLGVRVDAFGKGLKDLKRGGVDTDTGEIGLDLSTISRAGWVLTSYETYRDYQLSFGRVQWSLAVFDEVQKVKNPGAAMTDAAKSVNADFIVALTGTPVENRLADLWSIIDLVQPGLLGSLKSFSNTWEKEDGSELLELRRVLAEGTPPVMVRRLKEDHLEGLPRRRFIYARGRMPAEQAQAYDEAVSRAREGGPGGTLEALGRIRSVSLHPHARGNEPIEEYVARSARLKLTLEWLYEIQAKGEKVLVFAESRMMQAILAEIATELLGLPHRPLLINGQVSGPKRQDRVRKFQKREDGFDLMVLSPKAGGVGLTLTAANHVIHLSRWWNPAVEDQCTDRVYRIGQERDVRVYHPVAEHPAHGSYSFDVRLDDLLRDKRHLSKAVLAPAGASREDFQQLLNQVTDNAGDGRTSVALADVDALDGVQFERWVAERLREAGYGVDGTPWSGDAGVDLVARATGRPSLVVQCKHTQAGTSLQPSAVEEVLGGLGRYRVDSAAIPVVVTNSGNVSDAARRLAFAEGVHLWSRETLSGLSSPRVFLGPLMS